MKVRKLQGKIVDIKKTGEEYTDEEGNKWERCIFTLELTGFTSRTPDEKLQENFKDKKVSLVRYARHDWHFNKGAIETLDPVETEAVLKGQPTDILWR